MLSSQPLTLSSLAALFLLSPFAHAQTSGKGPDNIATTQPSTTAARYSFEVVSIRPSPHQQGFLGVGPTPDGFRATGITLSWVILMTHFPPALQSPDRIQNVPAWASKDLYDINAKVAPQDLKAWTAQNLLFEPTVLRAMLLSMLVDRCHLQMHTVPAEIPGFALAVSRHGASLHTSTPGETIPDGVKLSDGGIAHGEMIDAITTTWHFYDASMASLTEFLSNITHTRVLDQTDLTGRYDFVLTMEPDRPLNNHGEIMDPATFWNLRALGLRTVPTKVSTVNLIIDHIEPPSEN